MENNNSELKEMLDSMNNSASKLSIFLNKIQDSLPADQRELLKKEMDKAQSDISKAMNDLNNFKI